MLLKITLKCMSLRVVLDLLNQISNVDAMWSFHCWMWYSWNVEVNVLLVDCTVELVVRVRWCNVTVFFRTNGSFTMCVLELLDSTGCLVPSWACLTRMSSDSLSGFTDLSEEPSSLCKRFSSISWERDVLPLSTKTCSVPQVSPIDHRLVWVLDWVGLENLTRGTTPKDCWTSFPTGCCSTVEPNWSFPLVQLWSCRNEIFGGCRGDKYRLL